MRIYKDFREANKEIARELNEMGIVVHPKSYQNVDVSTNSDFSTKELQDYVYAVLNPDAEDLDTTEPWASEDFLERMHGMMGIPVNPGEAWKHRKELWEEFLVDGKFDYAYPERLSRYRQVESIIERLKVDRDSRQLFIAVWDVSDSQFIGGSRRVPCTLGYHLQCRRNQLNITYLQRSADFVTHFQNDQFMGMATMQYIADRVGLQYGRFTHWVGSLHVFKKDVKDEF